MSLEKSAAKATIEGSDVATQHSLGKPKSSRSRHHMPNRTIIVMLSGLILAVLAAVGHHLWNNHWNGMVVERATLSQTWVKNFGTAFAFLVKMFLAIITSTAFVQQFWITLKAKPVAIGQVDSMFTVLQSALQFLNVKIWIYNPILALLAIVTWMLPLAAIVTPGTLNVISANVTSVVQHPVPQFDFTSKSISFGTSATEGGHIIGASSRLQRLSVFTTSGLEISQIQVPFVNATYNLDFMAPAISCLPTTDTSLVTRIISWLESNEGVNEPWFSFVPAKLNSVSSNFNPFNTSDTSDISIFYGYGDNFLVSGNQPASVFIVMDNGSSTFASWPMVECALYNASYQVNFEFTYPQQNISVIQKTLKNPILTPEDANATFGTPYWAYMNVMDAYANILIGYTEVYRGGQSSYRTLYQVTALNNLNSTQGFQTEQLISTLEDEFQNITLSLLSDTSFQPDVSVAQKVPVNVNGFENIYDYQSKDLYLAYGLSILVTIGCLVLALISIHRNSGSYTNDFSTVLRTTRHLSLRDVVDPAQSNGLSPLEDDLAKVKIVMMGSDGNPDVPAGLRVARLLDVQEERVEVRGRKSEEPLYHPVSEENTTTVEGKIKENV